MDKITVRGARTHNLKNINVEIPRDKFVVITGLSGSGKSSLAFDTLYAEGQRRYVESLSTYARQFLSVMDKPDVDHIEGLSPAISIEQKSTSHNPRSTVGTITEIYDYLRLLYARVGEARCPDHGIALSAQTVSQMVDQVMSLPEDTRVMLLAPVVRERKGEHQGLLEGLKSQGFVRVRIDGSVFEIDDIPALDKKRKHDIEVVVDRLKVKAGVETRLAESLETALRLADGIALLSFMDATSRPPLLFSSRHACPHCGFSVSELEPKLFSFNSPSGACPECDGLGERQFFDPALVVTDTGRSLSEGAIRGWDRRNVYYFHMLQALAKHYDFDIDKPFSKLPKRIKEVIFFGSGEEDIEFRYTNDRGDRVKRRHPFEGVIKNMERRYRETESAMVRDDLARYISFAACSSCEGSRLRKEARHVFVGERALPAVVRLPVGQAEKYFSGLELPGNKKEISEKILKEIRERLQFLVNVGLDYLALDRKAETLSGGEAQRIRLASQIGAGLVGVMYVLDEPSIGLHQRDNERLLHTLHKLRDLGNTVLVVEHDEDAIRSADFVIDIGPGAGTHGGRVIAAGGLQDIISKPESVTGQFLSGKRKIPVPTQRLTPDKSRMIRINLASGNNLDNLTVEIPIGLLTCITGVSGSGKSTLVNNTLYPVAARMLNGATTGIPAPAPHKSIEGLDAFESVVDIDQSPIGRTPRSNPATYTGVFTPIRELFAGTSEARSRGYQPGRFSFNVKGGRCEACEGDGLIRVEMHFLPDVYVACDVCQSQRYNRETLDIRYKGKNIHEVLSMTVEDALEFFQPVPVIYRKLQTLVDVGLSYITLGQNATTLSGGEAQRVKLAKELSRREAGSTLYILDEPTTGLHFHDIEQLLAVLYRLRAHGNTILVIEHNLDVIKCADWIVDLGPEGGERGGRLVASGTPETVSQNKASHTGHFLLAMLS